MYQLPDDGNHLTMCAILNHHIVPFKYTVLQFCPLYLNKAGGGRIANIYMAPVVCWALFHVLRSHWHTACPHCCFNRQVLLLFPLHTGAHGALAPLPWPLSDKLMIWTWAGCGSLCHQVMLGYDTGLLTQHSALIDPSQPLLATVIFPKWNAITHLLRISQ